MVREGKKVQVGISIPLELHNWLQIQAIKQGRSFSNLVAWLLYGLKEKEAKK